MIQIERQEKCLRREPLFPAPKKSLTTGLFRRHSAGHRQSARVDGGFAGTGELEEPLLAENRIVPLDPAAIEGVVQVGTRVGKLARLLIAISTPAC